VALPPGADWLDFWNDERALAGGSTSLEQADASRVPLFIRSGAIIPLQDADSETGLGDSGSAGWLTLMLYPDGETIRAYFPDADHPQQLSSRRDAGRVTIELGPRTERYVLRIKETQPPALLSLERDQVVGTLPALPDWAAFDAASEGYWYDAARHCLWARFATDNTSARLTYAVGP
jgi:hypothetical protein